MHSLIVSSARAWAARGARGLRTRPDEAPAAPWNGEFVDVDRYWAAAWDYMQRRQRLLAERHRLTEAQWSVDQGAGLIFFQRADGALLRASVQIVGAWNPQNAVFLWGWAHPSVSVRMRADAERTRWFGDKHDMAELTTRSLKVSEADAWRLAAVAMLVNGASGAYRGPTEGPVVFMTMGPLAEVAQTAQ